MAAFTKINAFARRCLAGEHHFGSDVYKVMLVNTLPGTPDVKADFTELGTAGGYTAGGITVTLTATNPSTTVGRVNTTGADPVWTATAAGIGPFRYAVMYNDTHASKAVVGLWDYGSSITLADTETFTVDLDGTNGVLTIT